MVKTGVFQGHYFKSGEFQTEASRSSVDGRKRSFQKRLRRSYSDMTYTYKRRV